MTYNYINFTIILANLNKFFSIVFKAFIFPPTWWFFIFSYTPINTDSSTHKEYSFSFYNSNRIIIHKMKSMELWKPKSLTSIPKYRVIMISSYDVEFIIGFQEH